MRLTRIRVRPVDPGDDGLITMHTPVSIEVEYTRLVAHKRVHLTFHLINEDEVVVLTTSPGNCPPEPGNHRTSCIIPGNLLNSGGHRLRLLLVEDGSRVTWADESFATFSVTDTRERTDGWMGREPSAVQVPLHWERNHWEPASESQ